MPSVLRSTVSSVLGVLSVLLLPVALLAFWADTTLTRTDVFVRELSPVVSMPQVQSALTERATAMVVGALPVPAPRLDQIEPAVRQLVWDVVAGPEIAAAWRAGVRTSHEAVVALMARREGVVTDEQGRVVLAVRVPVPELAQTLDRFGLTDPPPLHPVVTVPVVAASELQQWQRVYAVVDQVGLWAPFAVAALGVLGVSLANRRRSAAGLVLAGWAAGGALLAAVITLARKPVVDLVDDVTLRALANATYGFAATYLYNVILVTLAIVVGLGVALVVFRRRRV